MTAAPSLSRISVRPRFNVCILPRPARRTSIYTSATVHAVLFVAMPYLGLVIPLPAPVQYKTPEEVIESMHEEPLVAPTLPNVTPIRGTDRNAGRGAASRSGIAPAPVATEQATADGASVPSPPKVDYPAAQYIASNSPNATNRIQTVQRPDLYKPPKLKFPMPLQPMVQIQAPEVKVEKAVQAPPPKHRPDIAVPAPALLDAPAIAVQSAALQEVEVRRFEPPPEDPKPQLKQTEPTKSVTKAAGADAKSAVVVNAVPMPSKVEEVPNAEIAGNFAVGPSGSASGTGAAPLKTAGSGDSGSSAANAPAGSGTGQASVPGRGHEGTGGGVPAGQGQGAAGTGSGADRGTGPGTNAGSGGDAGNGVGKNPGPGVGNGGRGTVVPGITISGGTAGSGTRLGRLPQPRQGYGITIISGGSSGGANRDVGYFARQDTVYTVYIGMGDAGGRRDWSMQYCTASAGSAGLLVPPTADHKVALEPAQGASSGTVQIGAVIDEAGNPTNVRAVRGADNLAASAIKAFQQWHFAPAQINGKPVAVKVLVGIPIP